MEHTLLKEINKKTMGTYLDEKDYGNELLFLNFFPFKNTPFLSFETLIGSQGNPVAADIVTYDASAPLKTRRTVSKLSGDIPPTRIKKKMSEIDLNTYNILKAQADNDSTKLLDFVFGDIDACVEGCLARLEWVGLQALSQGYVTLTKANNAGVITADNIDFQMLASHKRVCKTATSTRIWSNATAGNPKPITDIEVIQDLAIEQGRKLEYVLMGRSKWQEFRKTTEVIQACKGTSTAVVKPTLAEANDFMTAQGLPRIVIIDSYVDIEDPDHTITSVNCWVQKYILFVPFLKLGETLSGPIAAETNPPKQAVMAKKDQILVQKYSTDDPVNEFTVGLINAFPSWPTIDRCYRFDTLLYAADGLDD